MTSDLFAAVSTRCLRWKSSRAQAGIKKRIEQVCDHVHLEAVCSAGTGSCAENQGLPGLMESGDQLPVEIKIHAGKLCHLFSGERRTDILQSRYQV